MESEERPRKLQKVEHKQSTEISAENDLGQNQLINDSLPFPQSDLANDSKDQNEDSSLEDGLGNLERTIDAKAFGETALSKNQQKKQRKKQEWEAGRDWRKQQRKEKAAERKQRRRNAKDINRLECEDREDGGTTQNGGRYKRPLQFEATQVPVGIILDCSYDELMVEKERISLASQITRCYSDVKSAPYRPHLAVSSFSKSLKERFDGPLNGHYHNWKGVKFMSDTFVDVAATLGKQMVEKDGGVIRGPLSTAKTEETDYGEVGEVVYLSSDSPHTLAVLKPYGIYIVGGLVDKNRYKGICYKRAIEAGIKTAKLPIGDYLEMNSRVVLATNHVVEIMLKWLQLGDWGQAFMAVMPKRKGGVLKSGEKENNDPDGVNADAVVPTRVEREILEELEPSLASKEAGDMQAM